jgi:hypothetical protein
MRKDHQHYWVGQKNQKPAVIADSQISCTLPGYSELVRARRAAFFPDVQKETAKACIANLCTIVSHVSLPNRNRCQMQHAMKGKPEFFHQPLFY